MGKYSFAMNDAAQWEEWGIDFVKYDWNAWATTPKQTLEDFRYEVETMARALRNTNRDIVFSHSNGMPLEYIEAVSDMLNCWRISRDIEDNWWSVTHNSFYQKLDKWAFHQRPGHWNDPDMLVIGQLFGGGGYWKGDTRPTGLTADEQYTHITLWSLLGSPLMIGCDLTKLDPFTLNLLTNDEVLAVNQDALGKQAVMVAESGDPVIIVRPNGKHRFGLKPIQVWSRPLEDGSLAVGLFNLGDQEAVVTAKWTDLKRYGKQKVRDLWRQKDLGLFDNKFQMSVAPHGAELVKIYR